MDWLVRRVEELERQMRQLQSQRSLNASSFRGGALAFRDEDGNPRATFGNVEIPTNPSGAAGDKYGVFLYGDDGAVALGVQEGTHGLVYPTMPVQVSDRDYIKGLNSATMIDMFEATIDTPPAEVLVVEFRVGLSGNDASFMLNDVVAGQTDEVSITSDGSWNVRFEWLHEAVVGWGDTRPGRDRKLFLRIMGRRDAGVTDVNVRFPHLVYFASQEFVPTAAANGNPTVS